MTEVLSQSEIDYLLGLTGGASIPVELTFKKGGKEIKQAIAKKFEQLQFRLDKRNEYLDGFLDDRKKVRSFLVRSNTAQWSEHYRGFAPFHPKGDISSEGIEETLQLCRRGFEIEQEIYRLTLQESPYRRATI
jgi:hypothetical protein